MNFLGEMLLFIDDFDFKVGGFIKKDHRKSVLFLNQGAASDHRDTRSSPFFGYSMLMDEVKARTSLKASPIDRSSPHSRASF